MMSETPQAIVRVTFLLGVTLLFAAVWQGDHAPGRRSAGASADDSLVEGDGRRSGWDAPGTDLPEGESGEMMLRHAESDTDRNHWEHAGSRPPWTAPGTDLPEGESEHMARGDDREASTSVGNARTRTLSSRPESHRMLAVAPPVAQDLQAVALADLPPGIVPGTYQVVDNAGGTVQVTLTHEVPAGVPATSGESLYETHPAPGRRIYWIRIDRIAQTDIPRQVAAEPALRNGQTGSRDTPDPTVIRSAVVLTGSLNQTGHEYGSPDRWLDHAGRWMDRALELVRTLPSDLPRGVHR